MTHRLNSGLDLLPRANVLHLAASQLAESDLCSFLGIMHSSSSSVILCGTYGTVENVPEF